MATEKPPEFYTGRGYLKAGRTKYAKLYVEVIKLLPKAATCRTIVDLGCGVGYFAGRLSKNNYTRYIGIDFSEHMLILAKRRHPQFEYLLMNLYDEKLQGFVRNHTLFTMLETLEHIEKDIDVLNKISPGSVIIGSVPSSEADGHVRMFRGIYDVVERYSDIIDFNFLKEIKLRSSVGKNRITIFRGTKK